MTRPSNPVFFPVVSAVAVCVPALIGGCSAGGVNAFNASAAAANPERGSGEVRIEAPRARLAAVADGARPASLRPAAAVASARGRDQD